MEDEVYTIGQIRAAVAQSTDMINDWLQSQTVNVWIDVDRIVWNTEQILRGVIMPKE